MTPTELTRRDIADGIEQQVVGAIIDHGGQVLLLQRPVDDFRGGTWELPSGKVEPGEDLIAALHREVAEESGLTVAAVTAYVGAFDYTSGSGKPFRQHTWSVTVTSANEVRLTEHDAYTWVCSADDHPSAPRSRRCSSSTLERSVDSLDRADSRRCLPCADGVRV